MAAFNVCLTGDSILTRRLNPWRSPASTRLHKLIAGAEFAFTNIEFVPSGFRGDPSRNTGSHLAGPPSALDELAGTGFNLFSLANNHMLDYGIAGLRITLDELRRRGLAFSGIGENLAEARMPCYQDVGEHSVCLISCTSTFLPGQEASEQRPDMQGRPGVNPLGFSEHYEVLPDQIEALRRLGRELGLEAEWQGIVKLGMGHDTAAPNGIIFAGHEFRAASAVKRRREASERDLSALVGWVQEGRDRADLVIVSFHSHEQGETDETPPDFQRDACRRLLDAGADMIVCHGPHLMRGFEVHAGKPIFYSLGNFIGQNELTLKLPSDSYDLFRIPQSETPGGLYRARSAGGTKGFATDRRYWESVVPLCEYADGRVTRVRFHPIVLGMKGIPAHRGRPELASDDEARAVLERFSGLCLPFGAELRHDGETLVAELS